MQIDKIISIWVKWSHADTLEHVGVIVSKGKARLRRPKTQTRYLHKFVVCHKFLEIRKFSHRNGHLAGAISHQILCVTSTLDLQTRRQARSSVQRTQNKQLKPGLVNRTSFSSLANMERDCLTLHCSRKSANRAVIHDDSRLLRRFGRSSAENGGIGIAIRSTCEWDSALACSSRRSPIHRQLLF